jgi:hypothetical protein
MTTCGANPYATIALADTVANGGDLNVSSVAAVARVNLKEGTRYALFLTAPLQLTTTGEGTLEGTTLTLTVRRAGVDASPLAQQTLALTASAGSSLSSATASLAVEVGQGEFELTAVVAPTSSVGAGLVTAAVSLTYIAVLKYLA